MADEQLSLEPLLKAIDDLMHRLRAADVSAEREYKREKALLTLDGVRQILTAECLAPDNCPSFYCLDDDDSK